MNRPAKRLREVLGVLLVGATTAAAGADPIYWEEIPTQDTWVGFHDGETDFNNRNGANLEAQGDFNDTARQGRALMYWDLASIPAGSTITSATLYLGLRGYNNTPQDATVEYRLVTAGNSWTDTGATWATRDGTSPWVENGVGGGPTTGSLTGVGDWLDSAVLGQTTVPANLGFNVYYTTGVPMTSIVQGWLDGTIENNGLAMQMAEGYDGSVPYLVVSADIEHHRDPDPAPTLVINYEPPVPEPATLGLLGLGGLALLGRARR